MLRVFSLSIVANFSTVLSGLAKHYLIATHLSVGDFGVWGSLVAVAAFTVILLPVAGYLDLMLKGFSMSGSDISENQRLVRGAQLELIVLASAGVAVAIANAILSMGERPIFRAEYSGLILLAVAQFAASSVDMQLRMQALHGRLALFQATRNLPSVALLAVLPYVSLLQIAFIDAVMTLVMALLCMKRPIAWRPPHFRRMDFKVRFDGDHRALWFARFLQFLQGWSPRLIVPMFFGAQETGLFFFAFIAQMPCSIFLSTMTQMYGHRLGQLKANEARELYKIQGLFVVPNLVYVLTASLIFSNWSWVIDLLPGLASYRDAGAMMMAIALFGGVLASDCQEYLLRTRGYSSTLSLYASISIAVQLGCLSWGWIASMPLETVICLCAVAQTVILLLTLRRSVRLIFKR